MKFLMLSALALYSSMSFANYKCQDLDSNLSISDKDASKITLEIKTGAGTQKLTGVKQNSEDGFYFKLTHFLLTNDQGEQAHLKISITPVFSRVPNYKSENITAELDYQGKVTTYDCQKAN